MPLDGERCRSRALSFETQIASANARAKDADARAVQAQLEAPRTPRPEQQRRVAAKKKISLGKNSPYT